MKILLVLTFFLTSCAGYHFRDVSNPLIQYDIKSITIPTFVNYSPISNVSAPLTRAFITRLSRYSGLKVYTGENEKADAILIGVIGGHKQLRKVTKNKDRLSTSRSEFDAFINCPEGSTDCTSTDKKRKSFVFPTKNDISLPVHIMIIKNPTYTDLKLARSDLRNIIPTNSKVVINKRVSLKASGKKATGAKGAALNPSLFNYTRSKALMTKSIEEAAMVVAVDFDYMVINAF